MIFTRDFVTREIYWQIASLVTPKSLFAVTHVSFFISTDYRPGFLQHRKMLQDRHRSRLHRNTVNSVHTWNLISCSKIKALNIIEAFIHFAIIAKYWSPIYRKPVLVQILEKYMSKWVVVLTYRRLACWFNGSLRRQVTSRPSYQLGHRLRTARSLKEQQIVFVLEVYSTIYVHRFVLLWI